MNIFAETITILVAILIQTAYFILKKLQLRKILLLTVLTAPVLYMSVDSMDSFLTCDETYIIYEPVNLACDSLLMWQKGALRTTDMIVGVPLAFIKMAGGFSLDLLALAAKSLHWLIAFILILIIIEVFNRLYDKKMSSLNYLLFFYVIMLLPVVLMAIKIINYDSLSMILGALAIFLMIYGLNKNRNLYLFACIISATLAAQEKLISSPLMWCCLCMIPVSSGLAQNKRLKDSIKTCAVKSFQVTLLSLITMFITFVSVALVNHNHLPPKNGLSIFYSCFSGFWPLLRSGGIESLQLMSNSLFNGGLSIILLCLAFILVIEIINISCLIFIYKLKSRMIISNSIIIIKRNLPVISYLIFILLLLCAIAGTYCVNAYLAPYFPIKEGAYTPGFSFNSSSIHFGASSLFAHLLLSTAWANTVFFNAIPTVLIVTALINTYLLYIKRIGYTASMFDVIFTGILLIPIIFGILQVPVANRYFNLFILIAVIKIASDFTQLTRFNIRLKTSWLIITGCFLILEVFPFGPLYGAFRPIWSNYPSSYNNSPSKGVLNPWWMGWGEEVSMAGKSIVKKLKTKSEPVDITIYSDYQGEWLFKNRSIKTVKMDTAGYISYSEKDFFVLNRMGITQSEMRFPENITAFDSISFRGFVQAWIFRGADLSKNKFKFQK